MRGSANRIPSGVKGLELDLCLNRYGAVCQLDERIGEAIIVFGYQALRFDHPHRQALKRHELRISTPLWHARKRARSTEALMLRTKRR
jgi:hypothetical protein